MKTENLSSRKARGAFFTPAPLADFLVEWAVRNRSDSVLEPSCGEAEFLTSAIRRLRQLGARRVHRDQINGVELHSESAEQALKRIHSVGADANICVGDFFDYRGNQRSAVVGNPPFIRYQSFHGSARAKAHLAARGQGVALSGLASSWASFVVHAASFVRPGGRLALVVPAELLTVNYAAPVRRFLLSRFGLVRLVLFEELVFPDVQEEVVLLLAEGEGPTPCFELTQVRDAAALTDNDAMTWISAPEAGVEKLMLALLPKSAQRHYLRITSSATFGNLLDWGETSLGMVTGNNRFFMLSTADVRRSGLRRSEVLPMSPPGSQHLRQLSLKTSDWDRLIAGGARGYLFYPSDKGRLSDAAAKFIAAGEKAGVHQGYKCRVRSPWWRVPLVQPPDLFFTYMNHEFPHLCANRAGLRHVNSVHGVYAKSGLVRTAKDALPLASLNSVTLLGAELVGRTYGGGILKLEPKEADLLPVPSPRLVRDLKEPLRQIRRNVDRLLHVGETWKAIEIVDQVLLRDAMGESAATISDLRAAREALYTRRSSR